MANQLQRWRARAVLFVVAKMFGSGSRQPTLEKLCAEIILKTKWESPKDRQEQWGLVARYATEVCGYPSPAKPKSKLKKNLVKTNRAGFAAFQEFYLCKAWRKLRYQALKIHGASCQCCGGTAISTRRPLHVDHIKPRFKFPELELELSNLQVLCEDCNMGKGGQDQTDWR